MHNGNNDRENRCVKANCTERHRASQEQGVARAQPFAMLKSIILSHCDFIKNNTLLLHFSETFSHAFILVQLKRSTWSTSCSKLFGIKGAPSGMKMYTLCPIQLETKVIVLSFRTFTKYYLKLIDNSLFLMWGCQTSLSQLNGLHCLGTLKNIKRPVLRYEQQNTADWLKSWCFLENLSSSFQT